MTRSNRHAVQALLALVLVAAAVFLTYRETRPVLKLYIWDGYLPPDVLADFEQEFAAKVAVSTYRNNDEMLARVKVSWSEFDVIMPSTYVIDELRRRQMLLRLRTDEVPNLANVRAVLRDGTLGSAVNAEYGIPYMLNFAGIAYAQGRVNPPPASWRDFFSSPIARAYQDQIAMLDEQRETMGLALISLGFSPNSQVKEELEQVRTLLRAFRDAAGDGPRFVLANGRDLLVAGEIAILATWAPEITLAQRSGAAVGHVLPSEGSIMTIDTLAIPRSTAEPALAMAFVNYLLRPDIARRVTAYSSYANSLREDLGSIPQDLIGSPSLQRPPEGRTFLLDDLGEAQHLYDAIWAEFRPRSLAERR